MASHRPSVSVTLPRDFKFGHEDGETPQTPARPSTAVDSFDLEAPVLPRQTFKLRRRPRDQQTGAMDEAPILPSIEMTEADEPAHFTSALHMSSPGYLAPRPGFFRLSSPPKTPASQVTSYTIETTDATEWSMFHPIHLHDIIQRPSSAGSTFSDSSATSQGSSFDSKSSFDAGSCTSPESDVGDPFAYFDRKPGMPGSTTPSSGFPNAKRVKTMRHPHFTPEMDNHLWFTYMTYVQDPRVTPFKMLPGTSPPLGVCHRVAREAKASWRGNHLSQATYGIPRISIQSADSPDPISPSDLMDQSTPTAAYSYPIALKWPRSEGATRRRLRELCKRKPSLSAHYMRLLRTRSPSPFESSSSVSASSSPNQPSAPVSQPPTPQPSSFSSRSLNVSLAEATAPSMQPDGPLAQLHNRTPQPPMVPMAPQQRRGSDWYARIGRSGARAAHQKSQSLQLGLGLGSSSGMQSNSFERGSILASPFDDSEPSRQNFLDNMSKTQSLGRAFLNDNNNRLTDAGPSLRSPFPLNGPMPSVKSLKRRFGVDDQSAPQQPSLEDVFTAPPAVTPHPMRNRGFSLGAVNGMAQNANTSFPQLFTPASSTADHNMGETSARLNLPKVAQPPRLGSPFGGVSNNRFNTFPRRFTPREAELTEQPFEDPARHMSAGSQPDS
ncbi:hypothetical protein E4T47_06049 [Aureobasidium subglaciale]|nr:hypothetical protein E4T47_06049 [Aureobasidium subglaciale]